MTRRSPRPDGCPISVWRPIKEPRENGRGRGRGFAFGVSRPCNEPIDRFGLCAKHAADKVRLS